MERAGSPKTVALRWNAGTGRIPPRIADAGCVAPMVLVRGCPPFPFCVMEKLGQTCMYRLYTNQKISTECVSVTTMSPLPTKDGEVS